MPCIGPLHRPRGGPKPDFDFAYLSHPPTIGAVYWKAKVFRDGGASFLRRGSCGLRGDWTGKLRSGEQDEVPQSREDYGSQENKVWYKHNSTAFAIAKAWPIQKSLAFP